jgi:hypothetical protein
MPTQSDSGRRSPVFLRLALGYVYLHFGLLKFFPDLSPAELIATQTVMAFSRNLLDATSAQFALALLETAIGLGLVFNVFPRLVFGMFIFHMFGTFMPLFLLPEFTFKIAPFAPSLEGQYIFKNVVYLASGWTVLMPEIFARKQTAAPAVRQPARQPIHPSPSTLERVGHEKVLS